MQQSVFDSVVIGAGIIGIATAYYLKKLDPALRVALVERGQPMAFTSAQSGENYRNWWPHPVMTAFTDHSIELMEQIALNTDNHINMTRGGYALATRAAEIQQLTRELYTGYANIDASDIRFHEAGLRNNYEPPFQSTWDLSPSGVDVLLDQELINSTFPSFAKDIRCVVHIRRAGSISSQQLGQLMLEDFRAAGGQLINAVIEDITVSNGFELLTTIPNTKFRAS
ncbi:MAG: glycine/D-amino acid oxidase-like deaminating enzyme, partial [Parasphingorhabdus sp.]